MAWALLNVGVSSCSHRLALCTSGCLLMALGAEPTTVDPFHFLLCLACPFSSAKWAWSTRFPSLTVKRKTPAPSFCGRSRSLAAGLQSVCSTPSFRKAFFSKSAVDFNLSRWPWDCLFCQETPSPSSDLCCVFALAQPQNPLFSDHILFPASLISCLACFGSLLLISWRQRE